MVRRLIRRVLCALGRHGRAIYTKPSSGFGWGYGPDDPLVCAGCGADLAEHDAVVVDTSLEPCFDHVFHQLGCVKCEAAEVVRGRNGAA